MSSRNSNKFPRYEREVHYYRAPEFDKWPSADYDYYLIPVAKSVPEYIKISPSVSNSYLVKTIWLKSFYTYYAAANRRSAFKTEYSVDKSVCGWPYARNTVNFERGRNTEVVRTMVLSRSENNEKSQHPNLHNQDAQTVRGGPVSNIVSLLLFVSWTTTVYEQQSGSHARASIFDEPNAMWCTSSDAKVVEGNQFESNTANEPNWCLSCA